jgi:hypothetical protein
MMCNPFEQYVTNLSDPQQAAQPFYATVRSVAYNQKLHCQSVTFGRHALETLPRGEQATHPWHLFVLLARKNQGQNPTAWGSWFITVLLLQTLFVALDEK